MYPTASPGPPISGSSRVFAGGGEKHPAITVEIERKKKEGKKKANLSFFAVFQDPTIYSGLCL